MKRRFRDALAAVAVVVGFMRGTVPSEPRICEKCGAPTRRLSPAQCAQIAAKVLPTCSRRRCGGSLWRAHAYPYVQHAQEVAE